MVLRGSVLAAAFVALSGVAAVPATADTQSWPMLQGGPAHQGSAQGAVAPPLKHAWQAVALRDDRFASVAVIPGLAVGVARTQVVGMDPSTGDVLWTVARADGPLSAAAIDPAVGANGIVVFTEGDQGGKSALVGLDPSNQKRLWSLSLGDLARGSPTLDAGRAYVGARDSFVYAADAATGLLLWKTRTPGEVNASPAVGEGRVFVVSENGITGDVRLAALDTATGRSRWSYPQPQAALGPSSATVADGVVYVGFGDLVVRAFNATTGRLLWTRLVRGPFTYLGSPGVAGGSVYVLDNVGGVYRLDARTGHRIWDYQFPADVRWSSSVVADRYVYVGMDDGTVAAIDDGTGHLVWRTKVTGQVGALAPAGDLLLAPLVTGTGGIVAFAHDASGVLVDQPSPTTLDLPVALANFAGAFVIMTALLLGVFSFVIRPREERPRAGTTVQAEAP
jgi:outer membrane protein assembly factor BamB